MTKDPSRRRPRRSDGTIRIHSGTRTLALFATSMILASAVVVRGMVLPNARRGVPRTLQSYNIDTLSGSSGETVVVPASPCISSTAPTTLESAVRSIHLSSKGTSSSSSPSLIKPWQSLFDLELPEGRCVGIRLDAPSRHDHADALTPTAIARPSHWIHALLHPLEVQYAMAQPSETSQRNFLLGRLAMREAMLIPPDASILRDEHGRPTVPRGYLGSISHKRTTGVALVAADDCRVAEHGSCPIKGIGVDIEQAASRGRRSIAKRVLTERELSELGRIKGVAKDEEVLLRFSLKESLYKAMHPLICQYVGFQEAEVTPNEDGTATVEWNLKCKAHERFGQVTAHWRRVVGREFFLTSSSVTLRFEDE